MEHYLITFINNDVADIKVVANNPKEAKDIALEMTRFVHKDTHIMVKDIWLCTKVFEF